MNLTVETICSDPTRSPTRGPTRFFYKLPDPARPAVKITDSDPTRFENYFFSDPTRTGLARHTYACESNCETLAATRGVKKFLIKKLQFCRNI